MPCSLYSRICTDASTEVFGVDFLQLPAVTVFGVVRYYRSQIKYMKRSEHQSCYDPTTDKIVGRSVQSI